jgi:hypothetical protein
MGPKRSWHKTNRVLGLQAGSYEGIKYTKVISEPSGKVHKRTVQKQGSSYRTFISHDYGIVCEHFATSF